ncbi:hypothetical protein H310_14206 [Aphanomyces invadans]|uniref:Uncharacterized protein n=1 Tax=Aphanomyces invadans TaxID=157072 RepID=A0A024TAD1_9STRA|nr:hypothetical protein H310_14206 [Aphanomyces invadans]ETV91110.1 hypothetical protein H310_14206 [Aphanomyces invadans]|eukprot:XP_008880237.1 hypothetical protein H310_14206 [Aphanomyces invadans]
MDLFMTDDAAARGKYSLRDRESVHAYATANQYPRVHFMLCLCGALMILYLCWRVIRVIASPFDSEVKAAIVATDNSHCADESWMRWYLTWTTSMLPQCVLDVVGMPPAMTLSLPSHRQYSRHYPHKTRGLSLNSIPEDTVFADSDVPFVDTRHGDSSRCHYPWKGH